MVEIIGNQMVACQACAFPVRRRDSAGIERAALEFLETADVKRWMVSALEGR
jgi:hypothetical protein